MSRPKDHPYDVARRRTTPPPHGTSARQVWGDGCRCQPCRDASNQKVRESRARKAAEQAAWEAWKNQWKETP